MLGPYADLLAWNPSWERIAAPMGFLDDPVPSLARFVFTAPAASSTFVDWSAAADDQTSFLRNAAIRWRDDERYTALVAELEPLPEFAQRWSTHLVGEKQTGTKQLRHPDHGTLAIEFETMSGVHEIWPSLIFPLDLNSVGAPNDTPII